MSVTALRETLSQKVKAQEGKDLVQTAKEFVSNSNDFDKLLKSFSKFKLAKPEPTKESEMYEDTRSIFEPIASSLGLNYIPGPEYKEADHMYPDAWIVPLEVVDLNDDVAQNTILDIEVKIPWSTKNKRSSPWDLYSNGTDSGTPSVGLKEVIARALRFFQNSPANQQKTYFAVITSHTHFIFVSIDRACNFKMTYAVTEFQEYLSIIWYLCSLGMKAAGFRNASASLPLSPSALPLRIARTLMPIAEAKPPQVALQTEAGRWILCLTSLLGQGGHGLVFSCKQFAKSKSESDLLCLKLAPESSSQSTELLDLEAYHLDLMLSCPYVPKVIAKGKLYLGGIPYHGLLTDVVGVPLPNLSKAQLQSILPNLWHEMCFVLGQIHARGFVHCDVKPDHFVVNRSGLWLIDFGSSYHTLSHIFRQNNLYTTLMFSSPRVFADGTWPTAQDDIQSAAYSLVSLLSADGMLPEGHQSNPSLLASLVRPQHRPLVNIVLAEAHLVPEQEDDKTKKRRTSLPYSPTPKRNMVVMV